MTAQQKFFFTGEVAHRHRVSAQTVRNWIKAGLLDVYAVVDGRALISEDGLRKFEERRTANVQSVPQAAA